MDLVLFLARILWKNCQANTKMIFYEFSQFSASANLPTVDFYEVLAKAFCEILFMLNCVLTAQYRIIFFSSRRGTEQLFGRMLY